MKKDTQQWINRLIRKKELDKNEQDVLWKQILNHDLAVLAVHQLTKKEIKAVLLRKGCAVVEMNENTLFVSNLAHKPAFDEEVFRLYTYYQLPWIQIRLKDKNIFHLYPTQSKASVINSRFIPSQLSIDDIKKEFFSHSDESTNQPVTIKNTSRMSRWAIYCYAKQYELHSIKLA